MRFLASLLINHGGRRRKASPSPYSETPRCQPTRCASITNGRTQNYSSSSFLVRVLTDKDVGRVVGELVSLADKWHDIGVALRLTEVFMRDLKKAEKPPQESLREVVAQWLGGYSPCPNWEVLAEALRAKGVGAEHLAGQLDEKYSGIHLLSSLGLRVWLYVMGGMHYLEMWACFVVCGGGQSRFHYITLNLYPLSQH